MNAANAWLNDKRVDAIVMGGSAGALDVLRHLLGGLPPTLRIPVIVVLHLPANVPAMTHEVLQPFSPLRMKQAEDKEKVAPGTVYFAPPGYHLLVESHGHFALSVDEPVHFSRPAIDVLFESACDAYTPHLLGILLTGASQDGASGLQIIHEMGGATMVQSPATAEAPTMPAAALALFDPTFTGSPQELRALLASIETPASRHAS
jgi:two-component system chemotaxis response regulator CheB